jgi:hypothetical protein
VTEQDNERSSSSRQPYQKNISFSRFLIGNKSLTQQNFAKLTFQSAIKVKKPSIPDTQKLSRNQKQTV